MIRETFDRIAAGCDVRKNLIALKTELKEESGRNALKFYIVDKTGILIELLGQQDAKVRKNTALVMGLLAMQEFAAPLFAAYQREETLFVRSAYLAALEALDYSPYVPYLRERLKELYGRAFEPEEKKHLEEEIRGISKLLTKASGEKKHRFTGYEHALELLLLTHQGYGGITEKECNKLPAGSTEVMKRLNAGLMIKTKALREVLRIRTFKDCLFLVPDMKSAPFNIDDISSAVAFGGLLEFLFEQHEGEAPFYFRLECKSRMTLEERSGFLKDLAVQIEKKTERQLVNSTSSYELEIRLIENKSGRCNLMVKLFTLPDLRFSYRKCSISESIRPVNAALFMALFDEDMEEGARVLDPFCGVGTMLIERNKRKAAHTMYGIDHLGEAMEGARQNTEAARQIIHLVQRDFFDFRHAYRFDEVITDMPRASGKKTMQDLRELYGRFFRKVSEILEPKGKVFLYTNDPEEMKRQAARCGFRAVKNYTIRKRESFAMLFVEE